ncbi:MAG: hypothetical protein INQ03_09030 [Candidatus Heimdallarchaeota archaeon]|nr:hypothetical protein [Candidatus Heimdallarchaeota archaeon]
MRFRQHIIDQLYRLPPPMYLVREYIIKHDLDDLLDLSTVSTLDRNLVVLIINRASQLGFWISVQQICKILNFGFRLDIHLFHVLLRQHDTELIDKRCKEEIIIQAAESILDEMSHKMDVSKAQYQLHSLPIKFPVLMQGIYDMETVLAFIALKQSIPEFRLLDEIMIYGKSKGWNDNYSRQKYYAIRRAELRISTALKSAP